MPMQGQIRLSTRISIPFVHLEMLKFNRIIAGEQLDVTIESRSNIQMTSTQSKKSMDIKGEIWHDWTSETKLTEGICGF